MTLKGNSLPLSELEDEVLCSLIVAGGSDIAFEEITLRYKGLISSIAAGFTYPGFDSGDFMQIGLLGLYKACKTYRTDRGISFKNFAALCIKRRFISLARSSSARKSIPSDATVNLEDSSAVPERYNPEIMVADKESDLEFFSLIKNRLSAMELCVLKGYVNGMSYKDIAAKFGLDSKAVDNALQRVRKKLLR